MPELTSDSAVEAGAACLAMVMAHYGREISVVEAHERCGAGRDGASARAIADAARAYGLRVHPVVLELDELQDLATPAILHWGFSSFVVLERWGERGVSIIDPSVGRRILRREEVSDQFTGVALQIERGAEFDATTPSPPGESATRMVARRAMRAPGARRLLTQVLLTSVVMQLLGLSVPLLTKALINNVLPLQIHDVMGVLAAGIVVLILTQLALAFVRGLVLVNLQAKLDAQLMAGFFEHLLSLPYNFFQERPTGDLLQRLSSNAQIRDVLSNQTLSAALDGSFVVFYGIVLLLASPIFGLVTILLGIIQFGLLLASGKRMTALVTRELASQGDSQAYLVETIRGIEALKASGAEDRALTHWTGIFSGQLEATMRRGRLSVMLVAVTSTVQRFASLVLLWVGAELVLDGTLSLGGMLALVSLSGLFLGPLSSLVGAGMQLQQVGGHFERIASVLRVAPEPRSTVAAVPRRIEGHVEFENVSFRYDEDAEWAVEDFSLELLPGQKVALVGRTGSGKSTVARLLLGLYVPQAGEVRLDGHPLTDMDPRALRRQFGVVMQEPVVFSGSIRHNISYSDPSVSFEAIVAAAKAAAIHDDVERMPLGYDTTVAEAGSALSGGQRQRLVIARALVSEPQVLVLDEATSALDSATEALVSEHLIRQRVTALVIAHRLSTVRDADVVVVMDRGRVTEKGTHDELMALGGMYAELIANQLSSSEQVASK